MIWYLCLLVGIAGIAFSLSVVINRRLGELRIGYAVLALAVSAFVLYVPIFFGQYNFLTALLADLINILRIVTLDSEYETHYIFVIQSDMIRLFSVVYLFLLGILHFIMPAISFLAIYKIILRFYSSVQMIFVNLRKKPLFVFSEMNAASLLLAKSINEHISKCYIVFAMCNDSTKKRESHEYSRYILHQDDIQTIAPAPSKKKEIHYFCISEDENYNLNLALHLIARYSCFDKSIQKKTHIYLFSEQGNLDTMIDSTRKGFINIHLISRSETIAYKLLDEHPLFEGCRDKRISVLLYGSNRVNESLLKASVWCGMLSGYDIDFKVLRRDADLFRDKLKISCKEIVDGRYDISFYSYSDDLDALEYIKKNCSKSTYIVVGTDDESHNIDISLTLRRSFYTFDGSFSYAPNIFAYIESAEKYEMVSSLRTSELNEKRRVAYNIIPFGNKDSIFTFQCIVDSNLEKLAKNVHLVYEDIFSDTAIDVENALERYNLLEVDKRSNRANAMHIRYKLELLGLDYAAGSNEDEVDLKDYLTSDNLQTLIRAEHDRWMAFLQSEGWETVSINDVNKYKETGLSAGRHKCPLLKMHPYICPFDDLPKRSEDLGLEDSTVYDRELIARIPDILHDKWNVAGQKFYIIRKQ